MNSRFYPRKEIKTYVLYKIEGDRDFTSQHSINISPGGVLIETLSPIKEGTNLELCFSLPNSQQIIKAGGKVVWMDPQKEKGVPLSRHLVGVEFVTIGDDSRRIIEEFLKRNLF